MDGVAKPDPDRGGVDGSAEHEVAFVVAGGDRAVALELVDRPLDDVALFVGLGVEVGWAATVAASFRAVTDLIGRLGNDRPDPSSSQVRADCTAGVGLVSQHQAGPGTGPSASTAADPNTGHNRGERQRIVAMSSGGDPRDRPAPTIGSQVDLARQPTA
jgi:hypothetical protein